MASKKTVSWDDIENDVKKYAGSILSGMAGKIRDDLTQEAFNAIAYFYSSWSPKYYVRHYYNFMEKSFQKYYSNPHGTIYRGGVKLTPEEMDDIYYNGKSRVETQEVFDTVYAGFHGPQSAIDFGYNARPEATTPRMWPSPMERILAKRDYIADHIDDYIVYGLNKAKKQSYSTIKVR